MVWEAAESARLCGVGIAQAAMAIVPLLILWVFVLMICGFDLKCKS